MKVPARPLTNFPTGFARVAVADRLAVRTAIQPAVARFAPQEAMVDRMRGPDQLRVECVDGLGQEAMALTLGRTRRDLLEGQRDDARWQLAERVGALGQPGQAQQWDARDHPQSILTAIIHRSRTGIVVSHTIRDACSLVVDSEGDNLLAARKECGIGPHPGDGTAKGSER